MPRVASPPDVRSAILQAATRLMERFGYKKMTIDDIAHEAGIGKATIYGYFENKQELALAVIDAYRAQVEAIWREIMATGAPPRERIRKMALEKVLFVFEQASRYCQSFDESMASLKSLVLRKRGAYAEAEAHLLAQVIQEGMDEGEFAPGDPLALARTILTCLRGLMPYNLAPRDFDEREWVASQTNQVIDLMLRGLQASPLTETKQRPEGSRDGNSKHP